MKRRLLAGVVFGLLCLIYAVQPVAAAAQATPEGFIKLSITGIDVNLRPLPKAGGAVVAQANTGDMFIAEQWPIENTNEKSQWYRIVFAVKDNGDIVPLSSVDTRFKAGFFPFVSARFATTSPVTQEEGAQARKMPYREGFRFDLGNNLPAIVRTFGSGTIERTFDSKQLEYFGVGNILFSLVDLPGLPSSFLWEDLDTPYTIIGKHFTTTKPGIVYEGIAIATPGFGKEEVRKRMESAFRDMKPEISPQEDGERWMYTAEMWHCIILFDKQGLVKSYEYYFTTG